MKGSTKKIEIASATGMNRSAVKKNAVATSRSAARTRCSATSPRPGRCSQPKASASGTSSTDCATNRVVAIWPTATASPISLAQVSMAGAMMAKPTINRIPRPVRPVFALMVLLPVLRAFLRGTAQKSGRGCKRILS